MIQVDAETRELFLDKVKQLLMNGESIQTHKTVRGKKTVTGTSFNGDPIEQVTDTVQTTRETKLMPTPAWVYELITKSLSVENAISLLESQGYVVVDPTIKPSEDEKESGGMTEETRDLCYSEFLGIKLEKVQELKESV
jgi:hypothetical protein